MAPSWSPSRNGQNGGADRKVMTVSKRANGADKPEVCPTVRKPVKRWPVRWCVVSRPRRVEKVNRCVRSSLPNSQLPDRDSNYEQTS